MERIYPRLSQRNIEEEVLGELDKMSHNIHGDASAPDVLTDALQEPSAAAPKELVEEYKARTSYSRNFGTFDVTICTGDDGTQIVLVLVDGRVALNGKPIQLLSDGHVVDHSGDPDPLLQRYYDHAMKVRAQRGADVPADVEHSQDEETRPVSIKATLNPG